MEGLIYGALAVCWLAYLVPKFLARRDQTPVDESDPTVGFNHTIRLLRRGDGLTATEAQTEAEVSTELTRRARRSDVVRRARRAARRRSVVLALLLLGSVALTVLGVMRLVPWWAPLVGVGAIASFVVLARFSVVAVNRKLDAELAELELADGESTVAITLGAAAVEADDEHELSIELSLPIEPMTGSLWDPIPVASPTYVSQPLAPRTVRTIDLSAPAPAAPAVPVTADADPSQAPADERLRDVG